MVHPKDKAENLNPRLKIWRDQRTKKKLYKARVLLDKNKKETDAHYVSRSLKTVNRDEAVIRANDFYREVIEKESLGSPVVSPTVEEMVKLWIRTAQDSELSYKRISDVDSWYRTYLLRWLKDYGMDKNTKAENIKQTAIDELPNWFYKNTKLAKSTREVNVVTWNSIVKLAKKKRKIVRDLTVSPSRKGEKTETVRQSIFTFSEEQFEVLDHYFTYVFLHPSNNEDVAEVTKSGKYKKNKDGSINAHHRFIYRLNLHLLYKILCLTGCRVGEARALKYKNVELVKLEKRKASYVPHVLKLEVEEYKAKRKDYGTRQVIAPPHLKKHIDRVRLQNPHNKDNDLIINAHGHKHTVNIHFRKALDDASEWWLKNKGKKIDLRKSSEGATLTLHHLRSYFITSALLDRKLTPATVAVQVGQSLTTTQAYYLARKPREVSMYQLGGHDVPAELLTRTYASSYE